MIKPTASSYFLLFLQGAIWGSSFQAIKFALVSYGPMTIAAGRITLAAIVLIGYALLRGHKFPREFKTIMLLSVVGFFNCALPFFLISWGELSLDSGRTAIFMATGPLIALAIAHFTSDERLNRFKSTGFLMGFVGVLMVIGLSTFLHSDAALLPQLAIILAATSYAISGAIVKFIKEVSSSMLTASVLLSASIMTVPASLLFESPLSVTFSGNAQSALLAILYLGLIPTGLAFLIRFHLLKKVGYTFVSQVGYLVPMFGVLFGVLIFQEAITLSIITGLALILSGIVVSRIEPEKIVSPKVT